MELKLSLLLFDLFIFKVFIISNIKIRFVESWNWLDLSWLNLNWLNMSLCWLYFNSFSPYFNLRLSLWFWLLRLFFLGLSLLRLLLFGIGFLLLFCLFLRFLLLWLFRQFLFIVSLEIFENTSESSQSIEF